MTLPTDYQALIAASRYARWDEEKGRRELWPETVERYMTHVVDGKVEHKIDDDLRTALKHAILNLEVMPSMRALMTAGEALERDNMAGYNCSFIAIDHPRAFDEILYILTCGTGVGFSCETKYVNQLPVVAESFHDTDTTIVVGDSRIGWASSFRELISLLYAGKIPAVDFSRVRKKGERLKVFGGRASGPAPLRDLFDYCIRIFRGAVGRRLTDLEVHGIVCKIGEIVVVGGVRRSALISLSDLSSKRMADAKSFFDIKWHTISPEGSGNVCYVDRNKEEATVWVDGVSSWELDNFIKKGKLLWSRANPEYALANNSAVYEEKPTVGEFMQEWLSLYNSKSGERGIYYRKGIRDKIAALGKRNEELVVGTNPCAEIALRSGGLCNLTEVVCRSDDTEESLIKKVKLAALLGTIQSMFTDFRYVRNVWTRNAEEERLLGVSLTGIYDCPLLNNPNDPHLPARLEMLRKVANEENTYWAREFGINPAASVTTVKPSGTVSQLVDSASGIHARHSRYYIRRIRQDNKDPLTQFLKDSGVPNEACIMKGDTTTVFSFPVAAPNGAVLRDEVDALSHLALWRLFNKHWSDHQVSVTVSVKEEEWPRVGAWVYDNFDELSGISFLPFDGGTYRQAPYEEVNEATYNEWRSKMPVLDWTRLSLYEKEDNTEGVQQLACTSGVCEI